MIQLPSGTVDGSLFPEEILHEAASKQVLVLMGSQSDWRRTEGMPAESGGMAECCETLEKIGVDYLALILSAHRTDERIRQLAPYIDGKVIAVIAGAGGAAHLPGMTASALRLTRVIGVPIGSRYLQGLDSLLSIVQMPPGRPVDTMGIGGGINAAVSAARSVAWFDETVRAKLLLYNEKLVGSVGFKPKDAPAKKGG